jgi:hypothetical protein
VELIHPESKRNAFFDLGERQISAPVKARHRAAERRTEKRALDKRQEDGARLFLRYRRWRQEQIDDALAGPHGRQISDLLAFLKELTLDRQSEAVEFAAALAATDADTRFLALRLIGARLMELREAADLTPFDDALPGQPATAFEQVREVLR